jgi:hypothetical protein
LKCWSFAARSITLATSGICKKEKFERVLVINFLNYGTPG